ncbi:Ankyrin repeat domain-containing 52 [Fusarium albosuccineum]|uniref:Ankyrin repeat domain-containing 52 n=1 Tax=Fusarium albosuccineum TaxID=1237068 RepID=A0A8H4LML5_9HYPO|nr:Ankyrin repeat domain-containing 52 [Fusarium albosuccineum]
MWASNGHKTAQVEEHDRAETRRQVHAWLMGRNVNHRDDDAMHKMLSGTCNWILDHQVFTEWLSADKTTPSPKLLWITAPAGFGKTVLSSRIVQHLSSTLGKPVVSFFFTADPENRTNAYFAMRSWVAQLMSQDQTVFDLVSNKFKAQGGRRVDIEQLLRDALTAVPECTLVLDGLNEVRVSGPDGHPGSEWCMSMFLKALKETVAETSARVLIVSRDDPVIRKGLMEETPEFTEYQISPDDVRADVATYSRSVVDKKLSNKSDQIRAELADMLANKSEGQFLWVKMQVPYLNRGKNARTLQEAIKKAPTSLQEVYRASYFRSAGPGCWDHTNSLLACAAFALRPLTMSEITEAALTEYWMEDLPVDEFPDSVDEDYIQCEILDRYAPLIEIRDDPSDPLPGKRTVHVHFSVREYLLRNLPTSFRRRDIKNLTPESYESFRHYEIARKCLAYLNYTRVWQKDGLGTAFRDYATSYWPRHVIQSWPDHSDLSDDVQELFKRSNPNYASWSQLFDAHERSSSVAEKTSPPHPVYYALKLGLRGFMQRWIKECISDTKESSGQGSTDFGVGCDGEVEEVVKMLFDSKAEIYMPGDMGWTLLHCASSVRGCVDIMRLLLDSGADPNAVTTEDEQSPLHVASRQGHVDAAELLLQKGAVVDIVSRAYYTPLYVASNRGHDSVVKLLLENGADASVQVGIGWAPLHTAAYGGYIAVIRHLVEHGAELDARTKEGWTPLHFASTKGWAGTAKVLVDHGADINAKEGSGWTPFALALRKGHVNVAKVLLDKDTEIASLVPDGWTLLDVAPHTGQADIVKERLDMGSVDQESGRTLLFDAARSGQAQSVQILLDSGRFAVNDTDWFRASPLFAATRNGHVETVEILLKAPDIHTDSKDGFGRTLLWWARRGGHDRVAQLLQDHDQTAGSQTDHQEDLPESNPVEFEDSSSVHRTNFKCEKCSSLYKSPGGTVYCRKVAKRGQRPVPGTFICENARVVEKTKTEGLCVDCTPKTLVD